MTDTRDYSLGILLWNQSTDWPAYEQAARTVDELGYDHLWAWDHLHAIFGEPQQPIFEGWLSLAAWAKVTSRARLGLLVGAIPFRNPGLVAKMATTLDECRQIVEKVQATGLKYMMAETVVYSREFLFLKEMYQRGELGDVQYLAASHPQDMDGWPSYWEEMIPMHYATHVVSPCLGLVDGRAEYVSCFGSGTVRDDIARKSGNRFAVESCHIKVKDSDLTAHIWRFLYDVARQYRESFDVYGTKRSFEWSLVEDEPHVVHTAKKP